MAIELKKGQKINLTKKENTDLGEILVNLNWNQKVQKKGFFGALRSSNIDLDLGCLFEMKNGVKGAVQALGNSFGNLEHPPFAQLDGDDRTGSNTQGENIRINGNKIKEIKRILIYAFIYEGVANWSEADGIVTIKQKQDSDLVVKLDEHKNGYNMCSIALIENVNDETFSVEKVVKYFKGHREMDDEFNWGLKWVAGRK
ncbi:TerD family protein [Clostridioides difficile]|uniref:TerD family protein n=1 Tax=Clostridioides TaxID=1870884 RepID=UPI001D102347|nr:TerD family protein [Clostridioides sp. ZZV15-6598]MDB0441362.1 Tellurium resistance [Clostridioides difficile]UWD47558.1 TerD family protein [Clostridioides difficile]UWI51694.1 TerD family protein [Clostridioides difficile]